MSSATRTTWAMRAALAAITLWSAWQRWTLLAATPFPTGVDGYFYPIQLRGLLEHGALPYPASPLTFWLFAPLAAATDPITGAKLGAAIVGAAAALPIYAIGSRIARDRLAGLVAAALAMASLGSLQLTFEFVKTGVGLTLALTAIWLTLRACERPSRARVAAVVIAMVATALAHKLALVVALAFAFPAAIAAARARGVLGRRTVLAAAAGAVVLAAGTLVLGAVAPHRFVSLGELGLVGDLFTSHARWSAPALAVPGVTLALGYEPLLAGAFAIAAIPAVRRMPAGAPRTVAIVAIAAGVLLALPWLRVDDAQGLGFRLRVLAFVPGAIAAAAALPLLRSARARTATTAAIAGLALVAATALRPVDDPNHPVAGEIVTHPALVSAALALDGLIPAGDTVVIPERHLLYLVEWYTRVDVVLHPDAVPRDHRWRLMPLAFIGDRSPLDRALMDARREPAIEPPIGLHPLHPDGFVLVHEPTWEWVITRLPARDRAYVDSWPIR